MSVADRFNTNTESTLLVLKHFNQKIFDTEFRANVTKVPSTYVNAMYTLGVEVTCEGYIPKMYYVVIDSRYSVSNNRFVPNRLVFLDFSTTTKPDVYIGKELINEFHGEEFLSHIHEQAKEILDMMVDLYAKSREEVK